MPTLDIDNLGASYGGNTVLRGVTMALRTGEVMSLIGPSGSGKSTLLRVLVGLLVPDHGRVVVDGAPVNYANKQSVRALRERCAIVFQQYNLFQNMNVLENVAVTPVRIRKRPRREVEAEAMALLARVGLGDKIRSYPDELSGGQQQRVAIARALALKPEFLFLDEITAALDPELVSDVLDVIRGLANDGMTMLIVSHEMAFVREISDRVVFMADGLVVETGTPTEIFDHPQMPRTRDFVGKILRH
ncbi:MAG: amino acid ABC transporter ATP-binding protein [Proteobacteria bacterium]|nr:amino acid ABC transporter ATP-binding protein [Pseudomonadota bacterium]